MKNIPVIIFLLLFVVKGLSQNLQTPYLQNEIEGFVGKQLMLEHAVDGSNASQTVAKFLTQKILKNYPAGTSIKLIHTKKSPSGVYYSYSLQYQGVEVYGKHIKAFISNKGIISWIHHNFEFFTTPNSFNFLELKQVESFASAQYPNSEIQNAKKVWLYSANKVEPAFSITVKNKTHQTTKEYVYNVGKQLAYRNILDKYVAAIDTPAYGYVYNPDPLTTAKVFYGGVYSNNDGADTDELTAERKKVMFSASVQGDSLILANNDFFVDEVSTPTWPPTRVAIGDTFNFTRSQYQFAEVNAFYHLNTYLTHIRKLGFYNLPGFRIKVDAHALNEQDASRFTSGDNPPTLQFGDGGVPDAEDADVIVHEFGHALSYGASPGTAIGLERRAMEEGLGDYFAASYSWNLSTHNWQKVFTWDGNNGGWQGRTVDYKGSYDQLSNNIWTDGQLLSTAFMRLLRIIGRDKADALMLEALYRLSSNMSMPQFANAVHQIDTLQNNGANFETIQCVFASVDILDSLSACTILSDREVVANTTKNSLFAILNSYGFAKDNGDALLELASKTKEYSIEVFDIAGKLIENSTTNSGYKKIRGQNFAPGIYYLKVSEKQTGKMQTAKLIKY